MCLNEKYSYNTMKFFYTFAKSIGVLSNWQIIRCLDCYVQYEYFVCY